MNNKPKVMILHNIISPYRLPLFEELSKKYDLTVYFCKENDKERKWSINLNNYSFKYKILPHKDFGPFLINSTLKKELNENNFDIYICGDNPESFFQCLRLLYFSKHKNKKFIFWSGNTKIATEYYKKLNSFLIKRFIFNFKRFIEKIYLNRIKNISDSFISYSKATTDYLISKGMKKERIFTGTQNYPESLLPKPTWKLKPKEYRNKKIILHLGYLTERKGVDYLIKAFNKLNRKDIILLIAGSGDQEDKLKELAKDNPNIKFLGYIDGVKKANYYSIADFFVFPTLYDVWGHVVTEALYYGLPIICTNKAEAKELINEDKTGFIIPDKDIDSLASKMKLLLDNSKLLKKMKENIKKISKSKIVDIKTSVKTFEKAIYHALKNKNDFQNI